MKPKRLFSALLCPVVVGLLLTPATAGSADTRVEPTNQEIISEVGRQTGLASDVLDKLMKESPALFGNIKDTITAVKIVDLLSGAQDSEALAELYNRQLGNYMDKFIGRVYPASFLSFVGAVKLYKDSLEAIRDYIFVPSLEATIYERYKSARGGAYDFRYGTTEEAYNQATASGKYFPAKKKMYDELVKAKGYDPKLIGKKLEDDLWRQIDDFWIKRLETKYQLELFERDREQIIRDAWAKAETSLKAIKAEAALDKDEEKQVDPSFFVQVPDDLPGDWWQTGTGAYKSNVPKKGVGQSKMWSQRFYISREQGYIKKNKFWRHPETGERASTALLTIQIKPSTEEREKKWISNGVKSGEFKYMGKSKLSAIRDLSNEKESRFLVRFYRKGFKVVVIVSGKKNMNSTPGEGLAKHFARAVAAKIN